MIAYKNNNEEYAEKIISECDTTVSKTAQLLSNFSSLRSMQRFFQLDIFIPRHLEIETFAMSQRVGVILAMPTQ